ncbi:MAG: hypothetical protein C4534_09740 [Gaiellales bacterium]|nr:MAG: hypothetical protein C4534_09740 [Gaiellales bacterium]
MARKYEFTPILGWSISRYDTFSRCRRMYYYNYYAKYDTDVPAKRIERLKGLTGVGLETGHVFHDMVAELLRRFQKTDSSLDRSRFFQFARRLTEEYCARKEFVEVYYGDRESIGPDDVFPRAREALENFLASDRYRWITGEAIGCCADWIIEPDDFGETRIDGVKAYCRMDFLIPLGGQLHILDWKAGRPREDKYPRQLLAYATAAAGDHGVSADRINPVTAYAWPEYEERRLSFTEADLEGFRRTIKHETGEMQALCADVEKNIPLEKDAFPPDESGEACRFCNFRELCGR